MALVGKDQLVHEVAERSGLGVEETRRGLEEMLAAIETELGKGNEVRLTGFGKFSVSRRKAREGRNPQTGEAMKIAARKVPHFSAGAELRNAVPQEPPEDGAKSKPKPEGKVRHEAARSIRANPEDEGATQDETSRSKRPRKGRNALGRPTVRRDRTASEDQDEAARDWTRADELQGSGSNEEGEADSVGASRAKAALVAVAGLAAGVAGGLALTHRR